MLTVTLTSVTVSHLTINVEMELVLGFDAEAKSKDFWYTGLISGSYFLIELIINIVSSTAQLELNS